VKLYAPPSLSKCDINTKVKVNEMIRNNDNKKGRGIYKRMKNEKKVGFQTDNKV
jgi:hypothetical protein